MSAQRTSRERGIPRAAISFGSIRRRASGSWLVAWRVRNTGGAPLTVIEAWHPHRRFRSSRLARSLRIGAGGSAVLELPARIDAAPVEEAENCFLILRVSSGGRSWRILTRFTLLSEGGTPRPRVEAVDVHLAAR